MGVIKERMNSLRLDAYDDGSWAIIDTECDTVIVGGISGEYMAVVMEEIIRHFSTCQKTALPGVNEGSQE